MDMETIKPHGGTLINRLVPEADREQWLDKADHYSRLRLVHGQCRILILLQ